MNISVIIPTYNRYKFLQRALESVYTQTYKPNEVIVIDDGSNDETSTIKKLFPHIKYIYQKNSGVSSARNLGIKNATNEWVAFLDSDDTWHNNKLQKQVDFHKENPNIKMSYTDELWIRDNQEVKIPKKFKKYGGHIFERCLGHCIIAPSSVVVHKKILNQVQNDGLVFDEELEVCEDYDLWLRVACKDEIGLVDEKLITKYAGHENQLSFKYWGMDRFRVIALEKLISKIPSQAENDKVGIENDSSSSSSGLTRGSKYTLIKKELIKKYNLLLKGAIKHDRIQKIKFYEIKLRELNE